MSDFVLLWGILGRLSKDLEKVSDDLGKHLVFVRGWCYSMDMNENKSNRRPARMIEPGMRYSVPLGGRAALYMVPMTYTAESISEDCGRVVIYNTDGSMNVLAALADVEIL